MPKSLRCKIKKLCYKGILTEKERDRILKALDQEEAQSSSNEFFNFDAPMVKKSEAVSREAVLDVITFEDKWLFDAKSHNTDTHIAFSSLESRVKALPSVTPKYTDEEIDKAQAVEQAYVDKMVELAVEEAKRPKGKWIIKDGKEQGYDIAGIKTWYIQIMCDKCGFIKTAIEGHTGQYKYCPNCGAEMSGGGEDANSN